LFINLIDAFVNHFNAMTETCCFETGTFYSEKFPTIKTKSCNFPPKCTNEEVLILLTAVISRAYRLGGQGLVSDKVGVIFLVTITLPPVQWALGSLSPVSRRSECEDFHFHLVQILRMVLYLNALISPLWRGAWA
jgi:hypothetical protein